MATTRNLPDNTNRNYLTYALTPPTVATAVVLILGRYLGDTGAVLGVFFTVFAFTAISTVIVIFFPAIMAAIERRRSTRVIEVEKTEL